jgi:uncharacterized protein
MVALVDADDPYHRSCLQAAAGLQPSMITTWPCMTEAMHLLYRAGDLSAQNDLWAFVAVGFYGFIYQATTNGREFAS